MIGSTQPGFHNWIDMIGSNDFDQNGLWFQQVDTPLCRESCKHVGVDHQPW
jgi:hypothetical protein